MRHPLLAPDLRELIHEQDAAGLRDFFDAHHPADTADLLDDLQPDEVLFVLGLLDGRTRAEVFSYLEPELQDGIAGLMERRELAALLTYMSHDERADLVTRLPPERVGQIMPLLAQAEREDIRRLAAYREGTAGAVMTSDYAVLSPELTAAEAIQKLRQEAPDKETIYYSYVVDEGRRLIGLVSLKDLILAAPTRRVAEIMQTDIISASVQEDREVVAQKLMEYDLLALPIVDTEGRLVGIVTHDDVIDVIVAEATEDVHRMAGIEPLAGNYLQTPFVSLWSKRGLWLTILFVGGFLTTVALTKFEDFFQQFPPLVLFIPLIISAGGNCGSQSATLITRALALGQITPRDWARVFLHEVLMGTSLGLALGVVGFVRALMTPSGSLHGMSALKLAQVVSLGVCVVVLCGNLVGALLPLLLKRVGLDPALMSNPVVASLVDVTGIVAYFAIAQAVL
jgi:magnesium transporter